MVTVALFSSVAVIVIGKLPAIVGVPVIAEHEGEFAKESPVGNEPEATEQVLFPLPPLGERFRVYEVIAKVVKFEVGALKVMAADIVNVAALDVAVVVVPFKLFVITTE